MLYFFCCNLLNMLTDVHKGLTGEQDSIVQGNYQYYHYVCDGFNDKGWGCGYRTLQTICSWVQLNHKPNGATVPNILEIQSMLVEMGDKQPQFMKSRDWIGCVEASYVLSYLYDWDCKMVHLPAGKQLDCDQLARHLTSGGGPIMAGGDLDCSAKCIIGVRGDQLLVVDPHFVGQAKDREQLHSNGWVRWYASDEFLSSSFYNLCLPVPPCT